jgi:hypothetical protein
VATAARATAGESKAATKMVIAVRCSESLLQDLTGAIV